MRPRELYPAVYQDLYFNLIHLYVLHHACRQPTFGLQIIEEVAALGYKLSPGTMYPLLDAFERKGLLRSKEERTGGTARRIYRATPHGRKAYATAREHVERLLNVISEPGTKRPTKHAKKGRSQ
jgi:PadR family transcriptional regulator PadR